MPFNYKQASIDLRGHLDWVIEFKTEHRLPLNKRQRQRRFQLTCHMIGFSVDELKAATNAFGKFGKSMRDLERSFGSKEMRRICEVTTGHAKLVTNIIRK